MGARVAYQNVLLLLFSVIVMLLCIEVALRIVAPHRESYYFETWEYSRNAKTAVQLRPFVFEHRPGSMVDVYGTEMAINSQGMRDREFTTEKPAGSVRIAAVGDSTTLGWGVPLDESYPKVLERKLNAGQGEDIEVLNFGVGNYNTFQELQLVKRRVLGFEPDILLLQFYLNDLEGVSSPDAGRLRRTLYLYPFLWEGYVGVKNRLGLYDGEAYYRHLFTTGNPHYLENRESLEEIIRLSEDEGIRLYIILIPELATFSPDLTGLQKDYLLSVVPDASRVIDASEAYAGLEPSSLHISQEDVHLNGRGQSLLAEAIYARIAGSRVRPSVWHESKI